jgi:hypothetical protein
MEHNSLSLEYDKSLINKILDDVSMRYIILFLYVIRNDLLEDLNDQNLIESYERILILDEIFKSNLNILKEDFLELAIDLGLFKNIRSKREFEQKDEDFLIKMGEETVTIEQGTIMVPADTLFLIITKKFKFLSKRNYNMAITRLKGVSCERTGVIHPFIYEIGEHDYALSDDLYYILDQFGNIYQAIKMEVTVEVFYQRFKEILEKIIDFLEVFDPILNSKMAIKKIEQAFEESKDVIKYLKEEKIKLSDKFEFDKIDKEASILKDWNSKLLELLKFRYKMNQINDKILKIKKYYSGKDKEYSYLEFIEKISFNEDNLVNQIQESLVDLREDIVEIRDKTSKDTKKDIKLLNLDFERFILTSSDD